MSAQPLAPATSEDLGGADRLGWGAVDAARLGLVGMGDWYTSARLLEAEQEDLLRHSWTLVASSAELAPGQYLSATVAGVPLVVWRDLSGAVVSFHNLCRHRGITLLEGSGPLGQYVTCPYHQWSYRLDGTLARVPQPLQFPALDLGEWGLQPVAAIEWHGMIFVRPAPDGPDFGETFDALGARLRAWLALPLAEVAVQRSTVACNWKLLVENHLDVYHLWYLHQRSLAAYAHSAFQWQWVGDTWLSHEPLKQPADAGPGLPGFSAPERAGIGAHLVFPNLMVVTTGDYLATYDAQPDGPERTSLTLRVRALPGAGEHLAGIRAFLDEDVDACERLQRAVRSPAFRVGPLAEDHEAPVRGFHARLRRRLSPAEPEEG